MRGRRAPAGPGAPARSAVPGWPPLCALRPSLGCAGRERGLLAPSPKGQRWWTGAPRVPPLPGRHVPARGGGKGPGPRRGVRWCHLQVPGEEGSRSPAAGSRVAAGGDRGRAVYHKDKRRCSEVIPQSTTAASGETRRHQPRARGVSRCGRDLLMYCLYVASVSEVIRHRKGVCTFEGNVCVFVSRTCFVLTVRCSHHAFAGKALRLQFSLQRGGWRDSSCIYAVPAWQLAPRQWWWWSPYSRNVHKKHRNRSTHGCFCWRGKYSRPMLMLLGWVKLHTVVLGQRPRSSCSNAHSVH